MQHRPPAGVRAQPRGPDRPGRKREPRARGTGRRHQGRVLVRLHRPRRTVRARERALRNDLHPDPDHEHRPGALDQRQPDDGRGAARTRAGTRPGPQRRPRTARPARHLGRVLQRLQAPLPPGRDARIQRPRRSDLPRPLRNRRSPGCGPNRTKSRSRPPKEGKAAKRSAASNAPRCPRPARP